jgi:hypothetical protein
MMKKSINKIVTRFAGDKNVEVSPAGDTDRGGRNDCPARAGETECGGPRGWPRFAGEDPL